MRKDNGSISVSKTHIKKKTEKMKDKRRNFLKKKINMLMRKI